VRESIAAAMGEKGSVSLPTSGLPFLAGAISDRFLRWKVPSDPGNDFSTNNADASPMFAFSGMQGTGCSCAGSAAGNCLAMRGEQPDVLQSSASAKDRIKDREKEKQPSPLEETQPSDDQHSLKKRLTPPQSGRLIHSRVGTLLRYNTCSKFNAHRWPVLHARQQITKKA